MDTTHSESASNVIYSRTLVDVAHPRRGTRRGRERRPGR